jgi:Asp-tRNA(Asn)/Glu-tRNA(Gln) amidotransferase A subunit family amidase
VTGDENNTSTTFLLGSASAIRWNHILIHFALILLRFSLTANYWEDCGKIFVGAGSSSTTFSSITVARSRAHSSSVIGLSEIMYLPRAMDAFMRLRGSILYRTLGHLLESSHEKLTPSVVWNIKRGIGVSADEYLMAEEQRSRIWRNLADFFRDHDMLLCAATSIAAFPNAQSDVLLIDGKPMSSIIDYMAPTATMSLFGLPALSIPCGWTRSGLPVGLQIVGRPFEEDTLLRFAYTLQENLGFAHRWPSLS